MPDFSWKINDLGPTISVQLTDETGSPIALNTIPGCSVKFIMAAGTGGGSPTVNASATIVDAPNGIVSYTPIAADTALAGDYFVEWQVSGTGSPAAKFTCPNPGWQTLHIDPDLDDA